MLQILVFGNPYLKEDSLALQVAKAIQQEGIVFKPTANLNDLLEEQYDAILDVAYGIPRVVVLHDMNKLQEHKLVSLHDYDVSFFLKLMKAMGKLQRINIIAIPADYPLEKAVKEVTTIIKTLNKKQKPI